MMDLAQRLAGFGVVACLACGCGKKETPAELAPISSASLEAPKAATASAVTLRVDTPTSSVKFTVSLTSRPSPPAGNTATLTAPDG